MYRRGAKSFEIIVIPLAALSQGMMVCAVVLVWRVPRRKEKQRASMMNAVGTAALVLVGGGILLHGIAVAQDLPHHLEQWKQALVPLGHALEVLTSPVLGGVFSVIAVAVLLPLNAANWVLDSASHQA